MWCDWWLRICINFFHTIYGVTSNVPLFVNVPLLSISPLTVNILDNLISITKPETANEMKSQLGTKYFVNTGDEITVKNVKIKLVNVDTSSDILVNVNGTNEIIEFQKNKYISGLEIINSDAFKQSGGVCCCTNLLNYL